MPDESTGFAEEAAPGTEAEFLGREPGGAPLVLPADEFAAVRKLQARLDELENAASWGTSCLSCATVLDASIRDHERAVRAEARAAELAADLRRVLPGLAHAAPVMPPETRAAYDRLTAAAEAGQ